MKKTLTYGLLTGFSLIIYFILMKILGQETNFALRFFNFVIIIGGTYLLLRNKFVSNRDQSSYFEGLGAGLVMNVVAVFTFIIFMAIYTAIIDPSFVDVLENSQIWGNNLTITEASFAIFIEGIASGVVISFVWMQYFKQYISRQAAV